MAELNQTSRGIASHMQVQIEHLDTLLGLTGEVIITSANLQDMERRVSESVQQQKSLTVESLDVIRASNESARRISQELHDLVMAIRLVEIDSTMRLFRRPTRDLARSLGRSVELVLQGTDTLVDKALAERLVDPILHLLRNAVDHGIETPIERSQTGKPPKGKVTVSACDLEHHTRIIVQDDGRGIDEKLVREAAKNSGIKDDESSTSLLDLICSPGVSTKNSVTTTSGRGVGMDLVKTIVEESDGVVTLESKPGQGTTFELTIPKLKAVNIIDALTLRAGDTLYALPIGQVVASIGIDSKEIKTIFEGGLYIVYQDEIVPIHDLQALLGMDSLKTTESVLSVVIVQGKVGKLALIISEFIGPQKLVNIPFDNSLEHAQGVVGTAVFTGGKLGMSIDIDDLSANAFGNIAEPGTEALAETESEDEEAEKEEEPKVGEQTRSSITANLDDADVKELLSEMKASLTRLQNTLLDIETASEDTDLLHKAFRNLHGLKGLYTMLEVDAAAQLAHQFETMLDYLRTERLSLSTDVMDTMLDCVSFLQASTKELPEHFPDPPGELLESLSAVIISDMGSSPEESQGALLGRKFDFSPTVELQVLSSMERNHNIYETYLSFESGRQAEFLVAYLILRRLGIHGSVLATLPPVSEIENGFCGGAIKVLWSTPLDEEETEHVFDRMTGHYSITEYKSVPTSIFQY